MRRARVSNPTEFLEEYGIETHDAPGTGEVRCLCPFHDDHSPSLCLNTEKQAFICPVCQMKGDLIDLAAGFMKVKRETILRHIEKREGESSDVEPLDLALVTAWHNVLLNSPNDLELLRTRKGLTLKTVKEFMLGKDDNAGRFTMPIPDSAGAYVNVRKWSPTNKDKKVVNMKGRGRRMLYPMSSLKNDDYIIIVEGEMKALLLLQMGFNAISPTGGASTWSPSWNAYFEGRRVYLMYDVDAAGKRGAQKVARSIFRFAKEVNIVTLPIDPQEIPKGDITDMVVTLNMGTAEINECLDRATLWTPDPLSGREEDDPEIYPVALDQSSEAKFHNKFVRIQAIVSAKDTAPYLVPKKVQVFCPKDREYCFLCPINNSPEDEIHLHISEKDPAILQLVDITNERMPIALKSVASIPRRCDVCVFKVKETQNVEELRLIPELEVAMDPDAGSRSHVVRKAYHIGHGIETNVSYEFQARVVPEPKTQYATLISYEAKPSVDSIEKFSLANPKDMEIFRPSSWTLEGLKEKFDDIYADFEANVTRIYHRQDLHMFYDIVYHSALYLPFQGKRVRGWMEGLVLGDSGQGKSETANNMRDHYGVGEKLDSKGATVAGLLGGMQETAKRWWVTWGAIPLNDRKLLFLEEVKGMATQVIEKLTDMRSSGIAELTKIEKAKTNARTRLVWISNPRSDQQIQSYNFGIYAIKELVGALEDVRRFDMAIVVASGDVDKSVLNMRDRDRPIRPHRYTSELCRSLILWAWSRKVEQIYFDPEAIEAVLSASEDMSKTFVSNIPLVEPADQRLKLARVAAALAARTFSSDETGEKLIVRACHARYAHEYLTRIYSSPQFGYREFSDLVKQEKELRDPDEVTGLLKSLPNAVDVVRSLLEWQGFSKMDWMDTTEHDRDEASIAIGILVRKNAIKRGRGGLYVKTPAFIALLKQLDRSGALSNDTRVEQLDREEF